MWYLLAAEVVLLLLLIKAVDWRAREQRRLAEVRDARVRAAIERMER